MPLDVNIALVTIGDINILGDAIRNPKGSQRGFKGEKMRIAHSLRYDSYNYDYNDMERNRARRRERKKELTEGSKKEGCFGLGDERSKSVCSAE